MVKTTLMLKHFLLLALFFGLNLNFALAQSEQKQDNAKNEKLQVLGDPGKGMFFVQYYLEEDAKQVLWTVTDKKGEVLVKEKFKKVKAGKNRFQYNYLHGPDGRHKFKIVADGVQVAEIEVLKKKK